MSLVCFCKPVVVVVLLRGRMSGFDYAVIGEWFDWLMNNSAVNVDLIGALCAASFINYL